LKTFLDMNSCGMQDTEIMMLPSAWKLWYTTSRFWWIRFTRDPRER